MLVIRERNFIKSKRRGFKRKYYIKFVSRYKALDIRMNGELIKYLRFKIMKLNEFEKEFSKLGNSYKTKDVDKFNRDLIKRKIDVSFLKEVIINKQEYHRTYFQVSLLQLNTYEEQFLFIEDNFLLLQDWCHVDQLQQFIKKDLTFDYAFKKAKKYIKSDLPFVRRWGYVLFIPTLVKNVENFHKLSSLLKDDNAYYVIMAEAWLISYMGIYYPDKTLKYLETCPLKYNIIGKAIQKICDSFRVSDHNKEKFREVRKLYK